MGAKEQKIRDLRHQFDEIISQVECQAKLGTKLHEAELNLFRSLLKLGKGLLLYYLWLVYSIIVTQKPVDSKGQVMENKGKRPLNYVSVFGRVSIQRTRYYSEHDKTCYPIADYLGLPADNFSYLLQDWLGHGATEMDHGQNVGFLDRILQIGLWEQHSCRQTNRLSVQVDSYYEEDSADYSEEGTHLSVGFDGKGIPIKASEVSRQRQGTASRLGRGKKKGVKREATVSVGSSFTPKERTAQDIINGLFNKEQEQPSIEVEIAKKEQDHKWHQNKHTRAFLSARKKAITYGIDQLLKRDKTKDKEIVVLIDGAPTLEKTVKEVVTKKGIGCRVVAYILDLIHLLEYIWKVANAYHGEKHPDRENWVEQQLRLFLNSEYEKVLEDWQTMVDKGQRKNARQLTGNQKKTIETAIGYVSKRPHMVDYKTFLNKGFPITTGAIESACGHFIKGRMERNGMRWTINGAKNMLNIRAVKINGDWDNYVEKFIHQEQLTLYQWFIKNLSGNSAKIQ
jgi:hypothetical protein